MIRRILVTGTVLTVLFFVLGIRLSGRLDLIASNPNPLIRHFAPTWRSLKKILDVPYILASTFRSSDLPIYHITLSASDRARLIDNLPNYPRENRLTEEFKQSAKAEFRSDNYFTDDARVRYRGVSPNHWNAVKKSWQINLPDESPLGARTVYRFFLPEDKGWVLAKLNEYRAKKFGLLTPEISYAWIAVDKVDAGIYYLIEGWEEYFLERNKHPIGPIFANENVSTTGVDLYRASSIDLWENRFDPNRPGHEYEALAYFLELVENASDEEFEQALPHILNLPKFYRWMLVATLSNSTHQGNIANQNVYFNSADGKLEPVSFDTALARIDGPIDLSKTRLVNRAMQIPRFRAEFTALVRDYVSNPANLESDLAFYDETKKTITGAIMDDTKKVQTSFEVFRLIQSEREIVEHNFQALKKMVDSDGGLNFKFAEETYPLARRPFQKNLFVSFISTFATRDEFLARNLQFRAGKENNTIILSAGTHIFARDVIVPKGQRLVIEPGSTLQFAPGVSLISYSPIEARGTAQSPIRIGRLVYNIPWGVFAAVNTDGENHLNYVYADGGKDDTINGIYFSGTLSFHDADIEFTNGSVARAGADDGIHIQSAKGIIRNSTFSQNSMDAIDIDFARGEDSIFENNIFRETGGDAMDLSFSEMTIRDSTVTDCGDKGVSVGEASNPQIKNITVTRCFFGVAVKDRSHAIISNSSFKENKVGIGLYRKKPYFVAGGTAEIINSIFQDNKEKVTTDEFSSVQIHEK